jgi:methylenetetrahydrofolate dehydrogenase (NADP+)/methenyltetrahydrofolate cyclohydrolase
VATIIDGNELARGIRSEIARKIRTRSERGLRPPGLVTILVGNDPASRVYVARKQRQSKDTGMHSEAVELPASTSMDRLQETIAQYNARPDIDGILVQLPLPAALDADAVVASVDPAKDVDGLHPHNQAALLGGTPGLRPCTPTGCMFLIDWTGVDPRGLRAVVVGRSALVGKPMALLLLERDATVVVCHSRTRDLAGEVAAADILVVAVGRPGLVRGEWVKPGAIVIDVGTNRVGDKLVGDVGFEAAAERAAFITPVPGGVGPMTVAMLLRNTYDACAARDPART